MPHRYLRSFVLALLGAALAAAPGGAQAPNTLPFQAGERATYQVKLGAVGVGSGAIEILGTEPIDGHPTLHARMSLSGGVPLARVNDKYDSWIDAQGLFSRRFKQDIHEVRYRRNRTYDFSPERRTYRRENGETGPIPTDKPLDDLSFLFYARTLPLNVGDTYRLNRYFKESGNPVVLQVVRRDTVEVPAGTFRTIVVRPVIKTRGIFGEGGQAEVHFSDDERRMVVMVRSRVPVVGSLSLHLRSYRASATATPIGR
jgi:hypothetical protein